MTAADMQRTYLKPLGIVASLLILLYVSNRFVKRSKDYSFDIYDGLELSDSRDLGVLIGEYTHECRSDIAPVVAAYAALVSRKELGILLQTRARTVEAVYVGVRFGLPTAVQDESQRPHRLAFETGKAVDVDLTTGSVTTGSVEGGDADCCHSTRSRVPERFWLTARDGERLCEFRFDESTQTEAFGVPRRQFGDLRAVEEGDDHPSAAQRAWERRSANNP